MPTADDLIGVVQRLSACPDEAAVMAVLRVAARTLAAADGVTVVLRDGDLCHYADEDAIAPLWKGRRFPMAACISGWCMTHRRQVAIDDVYADPRIPHDAYRPTFVNSLAMTPIRPADPLGAIGAYWAARHRATDAQLEVLQALGDAAAVALENVRLIASLRDAARRKDEFLAMLAHELRNPLAPLRNALYLLKAHTENCPDARYACDMADRQTRHLARLVDDLLDTSALLRGRVVLRQERLDLARIVRQTADDRRGPMEAAGLAVHVAIPHEPVWVSGDSTRLAQVFGNVLDNATKFTPAGGRVAVRLEANGDGREAVVAIRDTGAGIDPAVLPFVFEAFTQADVSLDRARGGLGLGLAVVKGLVEGHGGSVGATSGGPGAGTEVTIRLPRVAALA